MDLDTARALLQVGPDAFAMARRQAYDRQRNDLEGMLTAAATPALAEQYRAALAALTTAYETLELHHGAAASPALRHVTTSSLLPQPPAAAAAPIPAAAVPAPPAPAPAAPMAASQAPAPSAPAPSAPAPSAPAATEAAHAAATVASVPGSAAAAPMAEARGASAPRRGRWVSPLVLAMAVAGGAWWWHDHSRAARADALRERIGCVRVWLDHEVATEMPAQIQAQSGDDAPRHQYLEARAALRAALDDACQRWREHNPACHPADEAEQDLAAGRLDEAELAVARAEQGRGEARARAQLDAMRVDAFFLPLWTWVWGHAAVDDRFARWFASEDSGASACADSVHAQLEALDLPQPILPAASDLLAQLASLRPGDARLPVWRAKLAEVAQVRALLEGEEKGLERADGLRRDALAAIVERLAALVGAQDADVSAWHARLPQGAGAVDRLHLHFQGLAGAVPDAADVELLRLLARGLGHSDSALDGIARQAPDRLIAAADAADGPAADDLLVRAANLGSWTALARLVELQSWQSFALVDPARFDATAAPALPLGITARQLEGELLANWACRQRDGKDHAPDMVRARELMCADPITHAIVLHEAAWLWDDIAPKDPAQAKDLRTRSAQAAQKLLLQQPSLPLARWEALLELLVGESTELNERTQTLAFLDALAQAVAAQPEYAALALVQQGSLLSQHGDAGELAKAEGALKRAAEMLRALPSGRPADLILALNVRANLASSADNPQRDPERAIVLEHEAAAVAEQAHLDLQLGWALRAAAQLEDHDQGVPQAEQDFALAAAAFARAGDIRDQAIELQRQSDDLIALPTPRWDKALAILNAAAAVAEDPAQRGVIQYRIGLLESNGKNPEVHLSAAEAAFAAAAEWYGKASRPIDQAGCLYQAASCENPVRNPGGDFERVRALLQQAIALYVPAKSHADLANCYDLMARSYEPDINPAGDYATAGTWYSQAAGAAEQANDPDSESTELHQQAICTQPDNNKAGSWSPAITLYKRAADLCRPLPGLHGIEIDLECEAQCYIPDSNPDGSWSTALQLLRESLDHATTAKSDRYQGMCLGGIARCLRPGNDASGTWAASRGAAGKSVQLLRQLVEDDVKHGVGPKQVASDRRELANSLFCVALASMPVNDPQGGWTAASDAASEAAELFGNMGRGSDAASCLGIRARALRPDEGNLGSWAQAAELYDKAQALCAQAKDAKSQAIYLLCQGVCLFKGNGSALNDAARQALSQAADIAHAVNDVQTETTARSWLR